MYRDAILYACGANSTHGLKRTNADKRRAVMALLKDEEWGKWSDREIARRCGVDNSFASRVRRELVTVDEPQSEPRTYTTRHGTEATMKTANIGKASPGQRTKQIEALASRDGVAMLYSAGVFPKIMSRSFAVGSAGSVARLNESLKMSSSRLGGSRPCAVSRHTSSRLQLTKMARSLESWSLGGCPCSTVSAFRSL